MRTRIGSAADALRAANARCIPIAQRSPSAADRNASMKPSPIDFTS